MSAGPVRSRADVRHRVELGMLVLGADGKRLGRVMAVREHDIVVEKGILFPRRFTAAMDEIDRVEGDIVVLAWTPVELSRLPQRELARSRWFTNTGEKEIATGVAEERRRPVPVRNDNGKVSR